MSEKAKSRQGGGRSALKIVAHSETVEISVIEALKYLRKGSEVHNYKKAF